MEQKIVEKFRVQQTISDGLASDDVGWMFYSLFSSWVLDSRLSWAAFELAI